ncbi:MAG TPA: NAD(+)/NADH kinase [Chloroflexota bacterium]|nr:NAD(+)/NADH kinase [Chloroflexota bacterium]
MPKPARRIGIVVGRHREDSTDLASKAADIARRGGATVWEAGSWEAPEVQDHLQGTDLVVCFGGDGTIIRGARLAAPFDVPVAGVNFGKMGFLAEFAPEEVTVALPGLFAGEFWIEERITLDVQHRRNGERLNSYLTINEAVVGRGRVNRVVRLHTWVDDQYLTSYAADGLLVATPTGSTASNLAAGGPVLPPDMEALVMVPVMPFVSFRNPVVLSASSRVDVQVDVTPAPPLHEAILSIDGGTTVMVQDGDRLTFTVGDVRCRFARVRARNYFHAMLVPKLQRGPILPPLPPNTPSPARP